MDTSEYDQQQSWLLKLENPSQLHLSAPQAYTWAPSQDQSFTNPQSLQEVTEMTYDFHGGDIESDDMVQPWLISEAPTQSSTILSYDAPLSQDPLLWEDQVNSGIQRDWDSVNKPFNPEAASFQPRRPSSGQEITQTQQLAVTFVNAQG